MKVNKYNNGIAKWDYYIELPAVMTFEYYNNNDNMTAVITNWTFSTNEIFIRGDNFEKFKLTVDWLKSKYQNIDNINYKMLVFVNGLDKIYQFIKKEMPCEIFNISGKGLGTCTIDNFLELREVSLIGSDKWEEFSTSDNKLDKLLDYSNYYWNNIAKTEGSGKLPITIQQVVKNKIKSEMSKEDKLIVQDCFPKTKEGYIKLMKYAYIGGFCSNKDKEKHECTIGHVDFKTSYLARMLTEDYPMSGFRRTDEDLSYCLKNYACLIEVTFYDFELSRLSFLDIKRAIYSMGAEIDEYNRVIKANIITFYVNELDFELISMCYSFSKYEVNKFFVADKKQLPKYLRAVAEECYESKETKVGIDKLWSKLMTEIIYGATVKAIYNIDSKSWQDCKKQAILSPYWGVWTTSYARYELISTALLLGSDWLYSDTDSIFFENPLLHVQLIERYNRDRREKMRIYCVENALDYNIFSELGTFTYEENANSKHFVITAFKSLGPKRYIYTVGKKIITKIAGYKKQYNVGNELVNIWSKTFGDNDEMYDYFEDNYKLKDVQKFTIKSDEPCEITINGKTYKSKSYMYTGYRLTNVSIKSALKEAAEAEKKLKEIQTILGKELR